MNTLKRLSVATFGAALVVAIGQAARADIPLQTAPNPVRPVLEGVVSCPTGPYVAFFGYKNENKDTVNIPLGEYNKLTSLAIAPTATAFLPGRAIAVFAVKFNAHSLVWTLGTPQGGKRTATASIANAIPLPVCPTTN